MASPFELFRSDAENDDRDPRLRAEYESLAIGVGTGIFPCPSLRTGRTVFPHPALRSVGLLASIGRFGWNEYVDRYHYLDYRQPFGCHLRNFMASSAGVLGWVLLAGAANALAARDQWIGWDRRGRPQNLPWVINPTRLLIVSVAAVPVAKRSRSSAEPASGRNGPGGNSSRPRG